MRIVVPTQCRNELLDKLHEGHFGIDRTKLRARDSIYWPGINREIEILVKTCETCQENGKRNNKGPVLSRQILILPWTLLEMDLFTMDDHSYLLVANMTPRFPVIRILNNETCRLVLNVIKGIYWNFKLPKRILGNNGPCFKAEEFIINLHTKLGVKVKKAVHTITNL